MPTAASSDHVRHDEGPEKSWHLYGYRNFPAVAGCACKIAPGRAAWELGQASHWRALFPVCWSAPNRRPMRPSSAYGCSAGSRQGAGRRASQRGAYMGSCPRRAARRWLPARQKLNTIGSALGEFARRHRARRCLGCGLAGYRLEMWRCAELNGGVQMQVGWRAWVGQRIQLESLKYGCYSPPGWMEPVPLVGRGGAARVRLSLL